MIHVLCTLQIAYFARVEQIEQMTYRIFYSFTERRIQVQWVQNCQVHEAGAHSSVCSLNRAITEHFLHQTRVS